MKTRILRLLLPAILVATGAGSVAWTWALAQHVGKLEAAGTRSAGRIDRLEALLDELTRDELSYVASGQSRLKAPGCSESCWRPERRLPASWQKGRLPSRRSMRAQERIYARTST